MQYSFRQASSVLIALLPLVPVAGFLFSCEHELFYARGIGFDTIIFFSAGDYLNFAFSKILWGSLVVAAINSTVVFQDHDWYERNRIVHLVMLAFAVILSCVAFYLAVSGSDYSWRDGIYYGTVTWWGLFIFLVLRMEKSLKQAIFIFVYASVFFGYTGWAEAKNDLASPSKSTLKIDYSSLDGTVLEGRLLRLLSSGAIVLSEDKSIFFVPYQSIKLIGGKAN